MLYCTNPSASPAKLGSLDWPTRALLHLRVNLSNSTKSNSLQSVFFLYKTHGLEQVSEKVTLAHCKDVIQISFFPPYFLYASLELEKLTKKKEKKLRKCCGYKSKQTQDGWKEKTNLLQEVFVCGYNMLLILTE